MCAGSYCAAFLRNYLSTAACPFCPFNIFFFCRSDHELELDLFLLQLCAAFAPADLYVRRILERYQLSNYLALDLKRSSEYVFASNCIQIPFFCKAW